MWIFKNLPRIFSEFPNQEQYNVIWCNVQCYLKIKRITSRIPQNGYRSNVQKNMAFIFKSQPETSTSKLKFPNLKGV